MAGLLNIVKGVGKGADEVYSAVSGSENILEDLISLANDFKSAGKPVPDRLIDDVLKEYKKVKPKTHLEGILAQGEQADLSANVLSQGYKPDVFHHVGSPNMEVYDFGVDRVNAGSTPAGLYTHNRMRDSKVYENIATENNRPWERYSVVSSADKPFVVGETKPNDALKSNFIKQMELKFGDKYSELPDHKRGYYDEKIDKFMQYGNTTSSPLSPIQQRQVYLDSGYDSLLLNGNEMVFLDTGKVRDLRANFNKSDVGKEGLLKSNTAATMGAGILGYLASSQNAEAGAGGTLLKNVMPAPQRMFDPSNKDYKPFLSDFEQQAGGRYLEMGPNGPVDITGTYPATANISVSPDGKPKFQVAGEERTGTPPNEGRKIKTNLFKKKAGWKWSEVPEGFDPNPAGNFPLVSVEDGKNHYYTVDAQFPDGAELARYPNSTSEPRLRPTRKGKVELGSKIGEIDVRGKKHPVYDKAVIREGATGAGILGALAASQSNDTYADYSPENLARLRTDDVGSYQAAQSPQLARAAGLMGQVNERGVDDPLMGMVSPRIPSELMNKIAYNDKRGVADYLKAAAGLLGLY